ncbi:hypothetical protein KUCAC02_027720%2C partial [Xyrichtys novacula]|uniref:Endonuclease/exonuclease/phosphatase domain-containing protein n=1 Tax=Xyrichtys novacula TaxID=13765 RepID=A0AAV1H5P8_XYRNO|nr:hypothetical protein KUCAC02_027720%2C partial [Xyrichtys novacula]
MQSKKETYLYDWQPGTSGPSWTPVKTPAGQTEEQHWSRQSLSALTSMSLLQVRPDYWERDQSGKRDLATPSFGRDTHWRTTPAWRWPGYQELPFANLTETPTGINGRLMSLHIPLAGRQHATLFSAYAPTLPSEEDVKSRFYQVLDEALHKVPKGDKILLLGDFNLRVGKSSVVWKGMIGQHGAGHSNANGLRPLSLCAEHNLTITNTIFQMQNKYKTSWMHPGSKHWHLLDYIIVRHTDLRDVHVTRAMRGAERWTDHRMIMDMLKLRICPALRLQKPTKRRLHCARLEEMETCNTLQCSLAKQLENIDSLLGMEGSTTDKWSTLSSSLYEAAAQSIGYSRKKHQDWFDENSTHITILLNNMHKAHKALLNSPSSIALKHQWQHQWQDQRRVVQCTLRQTQNHWWVSKAQEIQSHADRNDMHNFYDAIKSIHGPRTHTVCPLRTADESSLIKDQAFIVQRWGEHFEALLN